MRQYKKSILTYSNVTKEEMATILEQIKSKRREEVRLPERIKQGKPLVCNYATDTGERAFANLPCRGNKIICSKIEGHTSYTSACNPGNCKFFEASELTNPLLSEKETEREES